jgi:hypothetical protein
MKNRSDAKVDHEIVQGREHDSGVVHQHIDRSELDRGEGRECLDFLEAGDIQLRHSGGAAGGANFGDDFFSRRSARRAPGSIFASLLASSRAVASPMPLLEPVMRTTLFSMFVFIVSEEGWLNSSGGLITE